VCGATQVPGSDAPKSTKKAQVGGSFQSRITEVSCS